MSTPRIFSREPLAANAVISVSGNAARHITRVLRLRAGDQVTLFDGSGYEFPATLQSVDKRSAELLCGEPRQSITESPLTTELWQVIGKGPKMDTVIQKATELGVNTIRPLYSRYGVVKLDEQRAAKRIQHWQEVATSACEQCGRSIVPRVIAPEPLETALGSLDSDATAVMLAPAAGDTLDTLVAEADKIVLLIGPEGGFSDEEQRLAADAGVRGARLGPRILRTETAPLAALSVIQFLRGDLKQ